MPLALLLAVVSVVAACWAFIIPPWQVPDEPPHFSYTQTLVEEGRIPGGEGGKFADDLYGSLAHTNFNSPIFVPLAHPEWSHVKGRNGRERSKRLAADTGGGPTEAASYPPAFYLWNTVPYAVLRDQAVTTRLYGMRLWSGVWLLVGTLAAWLLIGEMFGRRRLLQLAGAATVGLWPMVVFMTTAINPDGMLIALWTVAFYLGTVVARRGLDARRGAALGAVVGLALITKSTGAALFPGFLLLVLFLTLRQRAWLAGVASVAAGAAAPLAWALYTRLGSGSAFVHLAGASSPAEATNWREFASYLWQFYLPRLDFMTPVSHHFAIVSDKPVLNTWLGGGTGVFGWVTVWFPPWVYWIVGWCLVGAFVAALTLLVRRLRRGRPSLGTVAAVAFIGIGVLGILAGTHWTDYQFYRTNYGPFAQGRYILPGVIGVLALLVAAAAAAVPARWRGAAVGVWVAGMLTLNIAAIGLVMERFDVAYR